MRACRLALSAKGPPTAQEIARLRTFFARATVATRLLKSRLALPIAYPLNAAMMREGATKAPVLDPAQANALHGSDWKLTQKGLAHVTPIVAGMSKKHERDPLARSSTDLFCAMALAGDSRPAEEPCALRLRSAQDVILLRVNRPTVIGRKECDIEVKHPSVSSRHASIEILPSGPAQDSFESSLKVALLTDLSSTNGTFAVISYARCRLSIGDYMRFGFCPWIYRLEVVPSAECNESTEWDQAGTSSRDERRQQQLKFAETSYLGWLTQVREEYVAVRSRAEAAGTLQSLPSLEQLEATCTAFLQRPVSRCASASSPFSRTWASKLPSPSGKNRPATSMAQLAMKESDQVDTLEGVEPCLADIEAEVERLAGRSWEVSSILRPSLSSAADLETALNFVTESLPRLASDLDQQVCGPTFQALLARGRPAPGHAARERTSSDLLNGLSEACFGKVRQVGFLRALPPRQVSSLVSCAEQLIGLLRVKIEDDADLALARTVLEDTNRFFWDLDQCAKWRRVSTWELFEEVASVLKAAQALTYYQGGHKRNVMKDPAQAPGDGWKENIDYRLHFMRPQRLKAAYGRGPGWIVTKTGMGHGWDDVGTGRVVDSPLHRKTVDPFDD
eukprot:symbB.v1.2.032746.t1/scaffold3968.1/size47252/1